MKNREIKFRVWNVNSETFVDQFEARIYIWGYVECDDGKEWIEPSKGSIVIEQFTGLKDKNGKEIYEGDIIHHGQEETSGEKNEVIFQNGEFGMRWQSQSLWHISCDSHFFEIIGNVHENAGLLAVAP